eukprot:CAMPEP_0178453958 /NCGR_PEP_ID=MMETSP0689_2-20121128/45091_1 /TAXON_ID=160604 /ORGANISM="Amphidinium massartii, Strain CS-259" /LENGTH=123 /DNA_ID=CAMNT_0020079837 /DNA_START=538 /DNA_END=908 /DNA_ORIENTATION=-
MPSPEGSRAKETAVPSIPALRRNYLVLPIKVLRVEAEEAIEQNIEAAKVLQRARYICLWQRAGEVHVVPVARIAPGLAPMQRWQAVANLKVVEDHHGPSIRGKALSGCISNAACLCPSFYRSN